MIQKISPGCCMARKQSFGNARPIEAGENIIKAFSYTGRDSERFLAAQKVDSFASLIEKEAAKNPSLTLQDLIVSLKTASKKVLTTEFISVI